MPFALLIALAAIAGGTLATYLYDRDDTPFFARACAGACTGLAVLGLVGFVLASLFGLNALTLVLATVAACAPCALLLKREWRVRVREDVGGASSFLRRAISRPGAGRGTVEVVFYAVAVVVVWQVFGRSVFVNGAGEILTGADNNLGDLPFHVSIVTSFAEGQNFPPEHTEFSGIRLTYPFLVDFVVAMFVRAGASVAGAMFWQSLVLALALVGLLHRWALKLTRGDRFASLVTPLLVVFSGGFGWWMLVGESRQPGSPGLFALLGHLPHDYTIKGDLYRWGNALTTLLIPQRGLLFGLPLALIVWTLWWQATDTEAERRTDAESRGDAGSGKGKKGKKKQEGATKQGASQKRREAAGRRESATQRSDATLREKARTESFVVDEKPASQTSFFSTVFSSPRSSLMLAAGIVAGLLPLVHAHSFVVVFGMAGCLALLFRERWREWIVFFVAALVVGTPQMWWATQGSAVRAGSFFGWQWGWESKPGQNPFWFWLRNAGLFIPLLVAAIAWRPRGGGESEKGAGAPVVPKRLLLFYLPFTLCFFVPNFYKLSPWAWDNIKVIFYWWVASAPLVALLLARLWRERAAAWRVASVALLVLLTLAGALDVWRVASGASEQRIFDRDGIALAELIKKETAPRSLILHAPTYNHPVFLSGRRSVMGYAGHLWSQGLDYAERERDVREMFAGGARAETLLEDYGVDYVVLSPLERAAVTTVNSSFFERYEKVGEAGVYRLYKTTRP